MERKSRHKPIPFNKVNLGISTVTTPKNFQTPSMVKSKGRIAQVCYAIYYPLSSFILINCTTPVDTIPNAKPNGGNPINNFISLCHDMLF
jgi:hypothetical protein